MGLIHFGVPKDRVIFLKEIMGLEIFVEGGTYMGGTAKDMSSIFKKVITIEMSDVMYDIAKKNLKDINTITILKGDTRKFFSDILDSNDNILFWLDAHWSGGNTYGKEDECPLIEELKIIFKFPKNYIILVDDARLFLSPPPHPHNFRNWPSIKDIFQTLPKNWNLIVYEDVIYLYPLHIEDRLKKYIQDDVTKKTESKNLPFFNFLNKVFKKLGLCKC